jgi:hypothetical protein
VDPRIDDDWLPVEPFGNHRTVDRNRTSTTS